MIQYSISAYARSAGNACGLFMDCKMLPLAKAIKPATAAGMSRSERNTPCCTPAER